MEGEEKSAAVEAEDHISNTSSIKTKSPVEESFKIPPYIDESAKLQFISKTGTETEDQNINLKQEMDHLDQYSTRYKCADVFSLKEEHGQYRGGFQETKPKENRIFGTADDNLMGLNVEAVKFSFGSNVSNSTEEVTEKHFESGLWEESLVQVETAVCVSVTEAEKRKTISDYEELLTATAIPKEEEANKQEDQNSESRETGKLTLQEPEISCRTCMARLNQDNVNPLQQQLQPKIEKPGRMRGDSPLASAEETPHNSLECFEQTAASLKTKEEEMSQNSLDSYDKSIPIESKQYENYETNKQINTVTATESTELMQDYDTIPAKLSSTPKNDDIIIGTHPSTPKQTLPLIEYKEYAVVPPRSSQECSPSQIASVSSETSHTSEDSESNVPAPVSDKRRRRGWLQKLFSRLHIPKFKKSSQH